MDKPTFSAPYPSKAQVDYNQNGLVLPKERKHLELLLRDVHEKGFLDLELLYQLKQRESIKWVEKEIADKLKEDDRDDLQECYRTFKKAFERSVGVVE